MKISYSPYQLNFQRGSLARIGALLRVDFNGGLVGYADCHPWPELGDEPLKEQLHLINNGKNSPLIRSALESAYLDAEARAQKKSLVDQKAVPRSHFLGLNLLEWTAEDSKRVQLEGFTHLKFKVGKQLEREIEQLYRFKDATLKIRLDFNLCMTCESFTAFLKRIEALQEKIDFIEDPFPFDPAKWEAIQKEGWPLACDREVSLAIGLSASARYLIIKPAMTEERGQAAKGQIKIVTSYLGHPLEQVFAAYVAAQLDPEKKQLHGLLSHRVFAPTSFSKQLNWQGAAFKTPSGTGWGFDEELAALDWMDG
ncbi:MAG: enolase C-terminal domain-like protein [Chlamydiales bacterium]